VYCSFVLVHCFNLFSFHFFVLLEWLVKASRQYARLGKNKTEVKEKHKNSALLVFVDVRAYDELKGHQSYTFNTLYSDNHACFSFNTCMY